MDGHRHASLRYVDIIASKPAVFTLKQSRAVLTGTLGAVNARQTLWGVLNLDTPLGTYPRAVVKAEDLESVETSLSLAEAQRLLRATT
ncbi:hypothetical protein ACHHYP_02582 [Achlya hypogyna]|uniref:Uncharacterized protein n=1 Tax=Achlya hypogyna TaxID=1202772 RepID=A0A1V9Z6C5_ACHHY|nr:hypothetical protein ACHHYP_02582 [Achlya hypogyna]